MLSEKVIEVIADLETPLSSGEAIAGWTQQAKEGYLPYFEEVLASLREGKPVPYSALVRSLDAWGIGEGELYRKMMVVANEINSLAS